MSAELRLAVGLWYCRGSLVYDLADIYKMSESEVFRSV